mgnify:FL=1
MRKLHKKPLIMAAAALALTGTLAVGSAMAYFTTYTTAGGGVTMNMGFTETIPNETVDKDGKHVTITNTGDYDCFVRVTAFAPMKLTYTTPNGGWKAKDDGYWYYEGVLPAGETTPELNISYKFPEGKDKPEEFNIVVIQECTPVLYDENGNPYADWNHVITTETTEDSKTTE